MQNLKNPHWLEIPTHLQGDKGKLSLLDFEKLGLVSPKRAYWIYDIDTISDRSNLAHKKQYQILIGIQGKIEVELESQSGETHIFYLDSPSKALFLPPLYWQKIKFPISSIMLCMASEAYSTDEYIRDYNTFKTYSD